VVVRAPGCSARSRAESGAGDRTCRSAPSATDGQGAARPGSPDDEILGRRLRAEWESPTTPVAVCGTIGPEGAGEAEDYHSTLVGIFTDAGVDMVSAYTLSYVEEAIGIVDICAAVFTRVGGARSHLLLIPAVEDDRETSHGTVASPATPNG
jgi:hypothetical protein